MHYKSIARALGLLLLGEAALMIPALLVALYYGQGDAPAFIYSILILLAIALPTVLLLSRSRTRSMHAREGFALVAIGWILLAVFGSLPFLINDVVENPVDAIFESVSSFTTTGASILSTVETLPRGLLFWRSLAHWIGGMGVLTLTIALLPQLGVHNMEIMRAETPGPTVGKLVPRVRETAKMLYGIYFGMSLILFLLLGIAGMPLFDALVNTFATAGTGGVTLYDSSLGGYANGWIELIVGVFMFLFGINFAVYFALLTRQFKKALQNRELWVYLGVTVVSTLLITLNILPHVASFEESLRYAGFQVVSLITTTGFATTDYNHWPLFSRTLLLCLMVVGASSGSTSGGLKLSRVMVALKALRRELHYVLHPRIVRGVAINAKPVEEETVRSVILFFFAYILLAAIATLIISLDKFDFVTSFSAVLATLSNIGPGLEAVGPTGNYAAFSDLSKIALSVCMLLGRLEILPVLLLFTPSLWRNT